MTISVIANFKAKSDQKETLEALLKSVIEPTLHEEGCLKYELYISENDSSRYFFLEEWRSREDLDMNRTGFVGDFFICTSSNLT